MVLSSAKESMANMTHRSQDANRSLLVLCASVGLMATLLAGCATPLASATPAEVLSGVSKNSDIRITWEGPESDSVLFGFPAAETELDRIYEKCRQLQGTALPIRQPVRFDGPTIMKSGPKPAFVRTVTTEIQCKQGDLYLWVAKIGYRDHRFYEDIQNRKRIQLHLRTQFIAGESLNPPQDEESKRRRAEAKAAAAKRDQEYAVEHQQWLAAQKQAKLEMEQAAQARHAQRQAELPAFRAQLKVGDRVGILHSRGGVSAIGLVIEVKPKLAQVQFAQEATIMNPSPKTELMWFPLEQLVQPDWPR